jgi:pyridoxamine 5'-phosphate oxidase
MNLAELRINYQKGELLESSVDKNPFEQFKKWFSEAKASQVPEPNAMHLSTIGENGMPNGRIVLLKNVSEGFSFYTNYQSSKGESLNKHPQACITFFWAELERQIRIEGITKKVDSATAEIYFKNRPRASQIGAWVSEQSSRIESRDILELAFKELEAKYEGQEIPKPPHWGGFELIPSYFEFWQGRTSRLHDRVIYELSDEKIWKIGRLAP